MIDQGVNVALAARDANRTGDDSHTSGTGGTEGVVKLTQWFERMETVFRISNCLVENQIELKKKIADKYCPRNEMKKIETELWNLEVQGNTNNLDTAIQVSPTPTTIIHKDYPTDQVIGDLHSTTQTRNMSKNLEEHGFVTTIHQRTNHKDLQNYLFACLLSQKDPKRAIDTKWIFRNKKDERGIVIRNKARLIDVNSAFLYGKIEEEVYVFQPPGLEDPDFPNKVYKVEKALYGLYQAAKAWYETLSTYLLDNEFHRRKIDKTLFIRRRKDDILLVQVYVDDIIFGSTKKELCNAFKKMMHEKFQMSSMGELTFFLGFASKTKTR
nr:hypothetical protein [Tanacetum cinerariifolium]